MSRHRTPTPDVPARGSARRATAPGRRRRQRSTRLTVAALLLGVAAVLVLLALPTASFPVLSVAAAAAVALGAAATRITHAELVRTRRDAAADRAERAHAARLRVERLSADHRAHAAALAERVRAGESAAAQLRGRLAEAEESLAGTRLRLGLEVRRAELAEDEADQARSTAARGAEQVAMLEAELDSARAALDTATSELEALRGELSTRRTNTGMPLWVAPNA